MSDTPVADQSQSREQLLVSPEKRHPRGPGSPDLPTWPEKRRRAQHNPFIVGINLLMTLAVVAAITVCGLFYLGAQRFVKPGPLGEETAVVIPRGANQARISTLLTRADVIRPGSDLFSDQSVFELAVKFHGHARSMKAGEYIIPANASMAQVMELLVEGRSIQHKVSVPEGYTSAQVVRTVMANEMLTGEVSEVPPEGSLLPETYLFTRGTSRQQIIDRMRKAHDEALAEIWRNRDPGIPVKTPEELVILASIVEKETAVASERPEVAGVFTNRLRIGQRLEADPTILYGLYKGDAWGRSRTITRSERNAPNEYNTYQIPALPPGPIANPGRAAMEAVANPANHEYFFFVADGTGGHAFAKTFDEHLRNVKKWRQIERQLRESRDSGIIEVAPRSSGN